jgi:hypothetical protein
MQTSNFLPKRAFSGPSHPFTGKLVAALPSVSAVQERAFGL